MFWCVYRLRLFHPRSQPSTVSRSIHQKITSAFASIHGQWPMFNRRNSCSFDHILRQYRFSLLSSRGGQLYYAHLDGVEQQRNTKPLFSFFFLLLKKSHLKNQRREKERERETTSSSDIRCDQAICLCTCLWIVVYIVWFYVPDAILFKFSPFLRNSTRVWRTDGPMDRRTDKHTLL